MARRGHKREQRKRQEARRQLGSPYRLIGSSGDLVACKINRDWQEAGSASIFVLRRVPGRGGHALAAFLIDLWCIGLKDAWGRLDITYDEFRERLDRAPAEVEYVPVDIATVRRLVAGSIRFTEQNGFRLPPRYERWTALLGDIGSPATAELSDFGVDGKLRFIGTEEDLRRRLIGCSPEAFLARKDVEFVLGEEAVAPDEDDGVVEQAVDVLRERGLSAIRQWCFANGLAPHPRLPEAWDTIAEAMMQTEELPDPGEELDDETADEIHSKMTSLLSFAPADAEAETLQALEQIRLFMQQFDSPEALLGAIGLEEELDDEDADDDV